LGEIPPGAGSQRRTARNQAVLATKTQSREDKKQLYHKSWCLSALVAMSQIMQNKANFKTDDSKISAKATPNVFYNCRESSTNRPLFMQNKANVKNNQMNVNLIITRDYEKIMHWTLGENKPNLK